MLARRLPAARPGTGWDIQCAGWDTQCASTPPRRNHLRPGGVEGELGRGRGVRLTDDVEAVLRARDGDLEAYELLVARYTALAHRTAYLLGAGSDADDVVQEAFVKAYWALGTFRADMPFRPWLLQIVANETRNLHRAGQRRRGMALRVATVSVGGATIDPEAAAMESDRRDTLLAAVRRLPDKDRAVVTCRYFLELTEAETAQVLGWPKGSVKSRLSRALDRLRAGLTAPLGEGVPHA